MTHLFMLLQACVDPSTKDELNVVEIEGQNSEGQKVKAVLATLKPSTLPSVSGLGHHSFSDSLYNVLLFFFFPC